MLASLTAHDLAARYRSGDATPTQATTEYLARIERLDPQVRAFLTVTREDALRRAAEADARLRAGTPRGPLDGVPVAVKDVFCTRGVRTTCGSRILEHFVPPYDATVVARLSAAGAVDFAVATGALQLGRAWSPPVAGYFECDVADRAPPATPSALSSP